MAVCTKCGTQLWESLAIYTTITTILSLVFIPIAIFGIIGIVHAVKGEFKPMPVIGNMFTILK